MNLPFPNTTGASTLIPDTKAFKNAKKNLRPAQELRIHPACRALLGFILVAEVNKSFTHMGANFVLFCGHRIVIKRYS